MRKWAARRTPWLYFLAAWGLLAFFVQKIPSPLRVFALVIQDMKDPSFLMALGGSLARMAIGYTAACLVGIGTGLLIGRFRWMDDMVGTLVSVLNAMPGAAWVPLAVLIFGLNQVAIIFTIILGATGIVMINTSFGVRDVPPLIVRAAQTMGAKGVRMFWHVIVPAAVPRIIDGLRLAWAFGWRALMAGELLIASVHGIGRLLNEVARKRDVDHLIAFMVIIAGIGIIVDSWIFNRLIGGRLRSRWGTA